MPLQDDIAFYGQLRSELIPEFLGQFVLIEGGKLVEVYATQAEALAAAVARFGAPGPGEYRFLIKEILDPEPVEVI